VVCEDVRKNFCGGSREKSSQGRTGPLRVRRKFRGSSPLYITVAKKEIASLEGKATANGGGGGTFRRKTLPP